MSKEVKNRKWKVEIVDITELGIRNKIMSQTIEASSLNGAKRRIPELVESVGHPELIKAVKDSKSKWQAPSKHRHVRHYERDTKLKDTADGYYIFISLVKKITMLEWIMPWVIMTALAAIIIVGKITYDEYKHGELRTIFMSAYPEYGKKVLKICDPYGEIINYDKLGRIAKDFNKEVRGLDRTYILYDDYDNMIRMLTQNQYRLEYSYLVKTPQYGEQHNEQSTD